MIKVAVVGASGRMGTLACAAVESSTGLQLVARIGSADPLDAAAVADVAVDLTNPTAAVENVSWCVDHGVNVVVATSGFDGERLTDLERQLADKPAVGVLVAPNLSLGALLMMRFAAQATPYFGSVEIIETHHPEKKDAPSGTATRTAHLVAASRKRADSADLPDATTDDPDNARGAAIDGIRVHSLRVAGVIAAQEVVFGSSGESFTMRHQTLDRASFMPGVLAGIEWVTSNPGLTVGLDHVLGFTT